MSMSDRVTRRHSAGRVNGWAIGVSLLVGCLLVGLLLANVHLVQVAFESQPECVSHNKSGGNGVHRAAKSSC